MHLFSLTKLSLFTGKLALLLCRLSTSIAARCSKRSPLFAPFPRAFRSKQAHKETGLCLVVLVKGIFGTL
jgi:hypothetical protein